MIVLCPTSGVESICEGWSAKAHGNGSGRNSGIHYRRRCTLQAQQSVEHSADVSHKLLRVTGTLLCCQFPALVMGLYRISGRCLQQSRQAVACACLNHGSAPQRSAGRNPAAVMSLSASNRLSFLPQSQPLKTLRLVCEEKCSGAAHLALDEQPRHEDDMSGRLAQACNETPTSQPNTLWSLVHYEEASSALYQAIDETQW